MLQRIGVDIIKISKIEQLIERSGERFLNRIFTLKEQDYCLRMKHQYQHFAARFAAKEAMIKALGLSWNSVNWKDIEVINSETGAPRLILHSELAERITGAILLSLSHFDEYAVAFVAVTETSGSIHQPLGI